MSDTNFYGSDSEDELASAYNADADPPDSDDESLVEVDALGSEPGQSRSQPREAFVDSPASGPSRDDKDRGAAHQRRLSSSQSHSSLPARLAARVDETVPLLDAGPAQAPPDYAAATADRSEPYLQTQNHAHEYERGLNYGSIPLQAQQAFVPNVFNGDHPLVRNGIFGERRMSNSGSTPQSMRDSTSLLQGWPGPQVSESSTERDNLEAGNQAMITRDVKAKKVRFQRTRRRWRKVRRCCSRPMSWFAWCLVFVIIMAIVVIVSGAKAYNRDRNWSPPPKTDDRMPNRPSSDECPFENYLGPQIFYFPDPGNFSCLELLDPLDYVHVAPKGSKLSGIVQVSPAPRWQEVDIVVMVSVATSKHWTPDRIRYVQEGDGLEFLFPHLDENFHRGPYGEDEQACMDFSILVQVKEGVVVQNWEISTANLDVSIDDGVFSPFHDAREVEVSDRTLTVQNQTAIYAVKGDVAAANLDSRRTRITTSSGRISGTYALRDVLEVESLSGAISVDVEPKEADPTSPAPAEFTAKSKSGKVHVDFPSRHKDDDIPERDYHTRVDSYSSRVDGRYYLGVSSSFTSYSGSVDVQVLPSSTNGTLRTSTYSSSTTLELGEPTVGNLSTIISSHKTINGKLNVRYPGQWKGKMEGKSVSGGIHVGGPDVEIDKDVRLGGYRRVVAHQGEDGESRMTFKTVSGAVDVRIEKEV